jgi:anti-anti-sigma regulatory factor
MRFEMATRGSYFATRDRANRLFAALQATEALGSVDEDLVLDFTGVTHVSPSFARYFVNRVIDEREEAGREVMIEGACDDVLETIEWAQTLSPRALRKQTLAAA